MRIYIAGPYSADTEEEMLANTNKAIDAGVAIYYKGHVPYIPHLFHFVSKRHGDMCWADYMCIGIQWLKKCDAILYLGSSKGADIELHLARKWGLKAFNSIDEIPDSVGDVFKGHLEIINAIHEKGPNNLQKR